uniref:Uncharacterized protein n=1 Tax=Dunaliella tertiolecta TaxID=3047 RepID=A0A7S3R8U6_DUNTE
MGTPRPRAQQGHPKKYADEVCVDWSCSGGLRWPGWKVKSKTLPAAPWSPKLDSPSKKISLTSLPSGQELPTKSVTNVSTAATASHGPDTAGLPQLFVWRGGSQSFRPGNALDGPG